MKLKPFALERYFAQYEFSAPHLLSCSDCEALTLSETLAMADDEASSLWNKLTLGYTESQGLPLLRKEVSSLYQNIDPKNILIAAPEEAIFIAMNTLLEKGDGVIVSGPGYQSLYEVAAAIGCEISFWYPNNDTLRFNVEHLESLISKNTKLIVLNFPHNPTGSMISTDELMHIIKLAQKHNCCIFSDEMYRFLAYNEEDELPPVCDLYDKGLSLFGMSKSFGMPGIRIGWLASQSSKLVSQCASFKDYTTICSSATAEILALIGLRNRETIVKRNLSIIENNLKELDSFFEKHSSLLTWQKPKAGPIAFPGLNSDVDITHFCKVLVEKKGVMLLPSSVYGYKSNRYRIGFGRVNMREALGKLDEFLGERLHC